MVTFFKDDSSLDLWSLPFLDSTIYYSLGYHFAFSKDVLNQISRTFVSNPLGARKSSSLLPWPLSNHLIDYNSLSGSLPQYRSAMEKDSIFSETDSSSKIDTTSQKFSPFQTSSLYVSKVLSSSESLCSINSFHCRPGKISTANGTQHLGTFKLIPVPVKVNDTGPVEEWKKVFQYPSSYVSTVTETKSYISDTDNGGNSEKKGGQKCKKKGVTRSKSSEQNEVNVLSSHSKLNKIKSLEEGSISSSQSGNSTFSLNKYDQVKRSPFHTVKDIPGSDTSSLVSNLSDLSSYESEYFRINQLISGHFGSNLNFCDTSKQGTDWSKFPEIHDYESKVRDLTSEKEDLEIQVHRLSRQLECTMKEKENLIENVEKLKAEVNEVDQRKSYEVMLSKTDFEGKLNVADLKNAELREEIQTLKEKVSENEISINLYSTKCSELQKSSDDDSRNIEFLTNENSNLKLSFKQSCDKNKQLESSVNNLSSRCLNYEENIDQYAKDIGDKDEEVNRLLSSVQRLNEDKGQYMLERIDLVTRNEGLANELEGVQKWLSWLKEQLSASQESKKTLQEDIRQLKEETISVEAEKSTLADQVDSLTFELQECRSNAVRDRNSLIVKLESLQTDFNLYEEKIKSNLNNVGSSSTGEQAQKMHKDNEIMTEELKKLRADLMDSERCIDEMEEKLSYKNRRLVKCESELKELHKKAVVSEEALIEKNIKMDGLINQLNEKNVLHNSTKKILVNSETSLKKLREEHIKMELEYHAIVSEKEDVEKTTLKVRTDVDKLSTALYKMKQEILTKDVTISKLRAQEEASFRQSEAMKAKLTKLEAMTLVTEKPLANEPITPEDDINEGRLIEASKAINLLNVQKESLSKELALRDDVIEKFNNNLLEFKEIITRKENAVEELNHENSLLRREAEENAKKIFDLETNIEKFTSKLQEKVDSERNMKKEINFIKECLHKESKLKKSIEQKIELNRIQFDKEKNELVSNNNLLQVELDKLVNEQVNSVEEMHSNITLNKYKPNNSADQEVSTGDMDVNDEIYHDIQEKLQREEERSKSLLLELHTLQSSNQQISCKCTKLEDEQKKINDILVKQKSEESVDSAPCLASDLEEMTEERDKWKANYLSLQEYVDQIPQRDPGPSGVSPSVSKDVYKTLCQTSTVDNVASAYQHDQTISRIFSEVLSRVQIGDGLISVAPDILVMSLEELRKTHLKLCLLGDDCQKCSELQNQLTSLGDKLSEYRSKVKNYEKSLSTCESQITSLQRQLEESQKNIADHETEKNKFAETLAETTAKQKRCESNVTLLTRKLHEHMNGRKEAEKDVGRLRTDFEKGEDLLKKKITELNNRITEQEISLGERQSTEVSLRAQVTNLTSKKEELEEQLQLQQKEIALRQRECRGAEELREKILKSEEVSVQLNEQVTLLKSDLSSVSLKLKESQQNEETLKGESVSLHKELSLLRDSSASLQQKLDSQTLQLEALGKEERQLHTELQTKQEEEQKLGALVDHLKEELLKKQQQLETTKSDLTNQLKEVQKELKNEVEEKRTCLQKLQSAESSLNSSLSSLSSCKALHLQQTQELQESIDRLRGEIATLRQKLSASDSALSSSSCTVDALTSEVSELRADNKMLLASSCELRTALSEALQQSKDCPLSSPTPPPLEGFTADDCNGDTYSDLINVSHEKSFDETYMSGLKDTLNDLKQGLSTLENAVKSSKERFSNPDDDKSQEENVAL